MVSGVALVSVLMIMGVIAPQPTWAYEGYVEESAEMDPWEPFNRRVFWFNDQMDRWFLRPIAVSYRAVMPDFAEKGVSNFFNNLEEIRNVVNAGAQFKWGKAGRSLGRFLINSTFGLAGVLDVASALNVGAVDEDFGQTLGHWHAKPGPYVVLPFLGPSTLRDTVGLVPDRLLNLTREINDIRTKNSAWSLEVVDLRASLLDVEDILSGDRYTFVRDAYLQNREFLVKDGEVVDDFLDDDW
ncbi:MAG: VacJ family lipoprotein [Gammaproteobacteria bacterium]